MLNNIYSIVDGTKYLLSHFLLGRLINYSYLQVHVNKFYIDGVTFYCFVLTIFVTSFIYTASNQYYFILKFIQFYLL